MLIPTEKSVGLFLCWVLKNYSDSDIIKSAKPIEYKHRGNLSFYRIGALFFQYVRITNLIKMQVLSIRMCLIALYIELVWRLSEFAFFVRLLRWSHFLFLVERRIKALNLNTIVKHIIRNKNGGTKNEQRRNQKY